MIAPSSEGASTGQRSIADDVMRAQRREADFENVARAAPRVKRRAAAAFAMGVDQFADRRVEAGLPRAR